MMRRIVTMLLLAIALLAASAASYHYYPVWMSRLRYAMADAQTREKLDTEELERNYRTAAKAFEQRIQTLSQESDIKRAIKDCNNVILKAREKCIKIGKKEVDEVNSYCSKRNVTPSKTAMDAVTGIAENMIPLDKLLEEIRVNRVPDKPTSIHTDTSDLLQRYRADVTVSFVMRSRNGQEWPGEENFVASASPGKQWTFPSDAEVKRRLLAELDRIKSGLQSEFDLQLSRLEMEMDSQVKKLELQHEVESSR